MSTTGGKNASEGSSALAYIECLEKCKSGNDALQLLVRISDSIAYIAPEDVPIAVKKLTERFVVESEAAVRAKIFWVFAELGEVTPDIVEKAKIVNETAELLRNEESHRVKSQGLATLLKLGDYQKYVIPYLIFLYFFSISFFTFFQEAIVICVQLEFVLKNNIKKQYLFNKLIILYVYFFSFLGHLY